MDTLLLTFRNLGPVRLSIMGAVLFAMIGFFIFLTTRLTAPPLALLYGDLQPSDSSAIAQQLQASNIPYEVRGNGAEVFVPTDQVPTLRMRMADQGLPSGGSIGYEIFDQQGSLGTTSFQQNVNLLRAMEGELARTITVIDIVRSARVHLVMPKRELFSRQTQQPSASIFLKMRGTNRLDAGQVSAVQHLVAAAVPGLNPRNISIIDDKGELLARGFEGDLTAPGMISQRNDERQRLLEQQMAQDIERLLEKSVGFGKVRVEVKAEMDFNRITTNQEEYDPDRQVVATTQTTESSNQDQNQLPNPVSVAGNLPDPAGVGDTAAGSSRVSSTTGEIVSFLNSKKITNVVNESGTIKRLSVAVLVDGAFILDENGDRVYQSRSPEEMEVLTSLVRGAMGFSEARNDVLEIANMRFADSEPPPEEPLDLFFGFEKQDLLKIAEMLVLTILAILVILLVVRPLISRVFEALPSAASALAEGGRMIADQAQLAAGALAAPPGFGGEDEEEMFDELIDIDRVEGRVKASSVKKVGEIVTKHPDEALSIVRNWLYQEG